MSNTGEGFVSVIGGGLRLAHSTTGPEFKGNAGLGHPDSRGQATNLAEARAPSTIENYLAKCRFDELDVEYDHGHGMLWYYMNPIGRPCATIGLMEDIKNLQAATRQCFAEWRSSDEIPVRYLVLASHLPGVFNLGGNLGLFADLIERRDRKGLEDYARLSIDVIHGNSANLGLPLITISLVQGDALGGGFEAALSSDVIVAERSAKFGLPEILFGLFPGMGAYSFLSRRIGAVEAERMIFSGKIYAAEELHEVGVVDVLAEDGFGEETILDYVNRTRHRNAAHRAIYQVRRRSSPVTYEELADISEIWVDAALALEESDIKKMLRLSAAQERRQNRAAR